MGDGYACVCDDCAARIGHNAAQLPRKHPPEINVADAIACLIVIAQHGLTLTECSGYEICGDHVSSKILPLVLLWQESFPLDQTECNAHVGQAEFCSVFLCKRRA